MCVVISRCSLSSLACSHRIIVRPCLFLKVFSSNDRQEIEDRVRVLALGFVALAIGAGLANFSSVSL